MCGDQGTVCLDRMAVNDLRYEYFPGTCDSKQKKPSEIVSEGFGPSGGARTHGLLLPKQARYHLRYTRIQSNIIQKWEGDCKAFFGVLQCFLLLLERLEDDGICACEKR